MERRIEIFVSGSTNPNISKEYNQAAKEFGKMIDTKKHNVIFDGCDGLPGVVASQIAKPNDNLEIALTSYFGGVNKIINNWPYARINGTFRYQSEVTRALLDWSDVAVFFKGGSGTLAELFHAIDTKKNREHNKPILILNIQNQWDYLIKLLEPLGLNHLYIVMDTPQKVMEYIQKNIRINSYYMAEYGPKIQDDYER